MLDDPTVLLSAAAITLLAGGFRGFTGFGSGLMMAPVMTLLMPPVMAAPVILMVSFAGSLRLLPEIWGQLVWRRVLSVAIPALLTIPLGTWLLQVIDATVVQKVISGVVLLLVLVLASGWRYVGRLHAGVLALAGMISGTLTGIAGVGGPPIVLVLMADPGPPAETRATLIAFLTFSQVVAIASFLFGGLITHEVGGLCLLLAPLFVIAAHLGARYFHRAGEGIYRQVALAFLALVAIVGLLG